MTACQKSDSLDSASDDVLISVSTSLPVEMAETRATGDGTSVNRCIMQIYLDGQSYGERKVAAVSGLKATFSLRLVAGKTYDFVFWADKSGADMNTDLHYNTASLPEVSFAEGDAYLGNDDGRDAFFGTVEVVADQSKAVDVDLKRPFGQLNVKTLDMAEVAAAASKLVPAKVKIAFKQIPTGVNLLTGELTDAAEDVAYGSAVALADNANNAGNLSFDYIFAPEGEQRLVDFTMSFLGSDDAAVASDYNFSSIPVQRNYRTNVSGNLLTKKADINVEVVPGFDGDINITEVASVSDLNNILNSGGKGRLESDLTVANFSNITGFKPVDLDLNGHTLTFSNDNGKMCGYTIAQNTTIRNGKIVATVDESDADEKVKAPLVCSSGYSLTLDNVEMESEGSCVGTAVKTSNATIIVKNSTLKCNVYAVSTSADAPVGDNVTISIEGSTLESNTPILVNIPCDLTIKDCTVKALMQGMILRGGTATVSDSRFTFDTTASFTSQSNAESFANAFLNSNWGTGNRVNLAAITVGNKTENSYQYPTVLDLKNTVVETVGNYASLFPAMYVWANQGEGLGVTITYDDQCTFTGGIVYGSENIVVNGEAAPVE